MALNIAVIYGSVRKQRQGIKAARFVQRCLEQRGHRVALIDPLEYPLPLLDRMYKEFEPGEAPEAMAEVGTILDQADGFMVVSAEYNHSLPGTLKNILDHYQKEYLYKPSGIVTYSAGPFGGVRALVSIRAILAELGTPSIPSSFPVSAIHKAFDSEGVPQDAAYERRIGKFLDEFEWYALAMQRARQQQSCGGDVPTQQAMCRGNKADDT